MKTDPNRPDSLDPIRLARYPAHLLSAHQSGSPPDFSAGSQEVYHPRDCIRPRFRGKQPGKKSFF